ncbi:reprolysin-like metallopeptidase [Nitrobacter sp. Nb-311A]|uniref:reprolysin-like metallopeptidase n=1 Tax=Nitrobacter sp. Nb-311A TaxID=314253 RepID=UPI000E2E50FD
MPISALHCRMHLARPGHTSHIRLQRGGGDAWFNNSSGYYSAPVRGNYAHFTIIHEIGHAHGLDHAHEDPAVPVSRDSIEYTVMSYRSFVGASTTSSR